MIEMAKAQITDAVEQHSKTLLESLERVYTSEECCVCMDDKPDVVFYQCGHQCCHQACGVTLTKCPLCRSFIRSKLSV